MGQRPHPHSTPALCLVHFRSHVYALPVPAPSGRRVSPPARRSPAMAVAALQLRRILCPGARGLRTFSSAVRPADPGAGPRECGCAAAGWERGGRAPHGERSPRPAAVPGRGDPRGPGGAEHCGVRGRADVGLEECSDGITGEAPPGRTPAAPDPFPSSLSCGACPRRHPTALALPKAPPQQTLLKIYPQLVFG